MNNELLVYAALILYSANYLTGWLLHFRKIKISKRTHQFLFSGVIISLIALIIFIKLHPAELIILLVSLLCMMALPFGKKGGRYHILFSSIGYALYIFFIILRLAA